MDIIIAIIGVGYVGLQNAIAISKLGLKVIAFDKNPQRVSDLKEGVDRNDEFYDFVRDNLIFTDLEENLKQANYYLISVPTSINDHFVPDVFPLKNAAQLVARVLKKSDVVILESTVFPGATRDLLVPILEKESGLKSGTDFFIGYSSERINPGDEIHNASNTYKVISGQNDTAVKKITELYEQIFVGKVFCASSLEVAESSKLLENIQRDVNIALMNEFAQVMGKAGISFSDVLAAASTKWNFIPFKPGLVGGHCIPEDPYYLIYQANKFGGLTNLISEARRVNEQFVLYVADMTIKLLTQQGHALNKAKIVLMGLSFKKNVKDTRHSLSLVLYKRLKSFGMEVVICDPVVNNNQFDLPWIQLEDIRNSTAIIIAQDHDEFTALSCEEYSDKIITKGLFMDIPGMFAKEPNFNKDILYWRL